MAKCVIVGAGEFTETTLPIEPEDYLIAADAGLVYLEQLNQRPHLIIGDFDSLHQIPKQPNVITLPVEKDDTDMGIAVQEGLRRGYQQFYLYGGCGGRMDHTLANIQLMAKIEKQGAHALLFGNQQVIQMLSGPGELCFSQNAKGGISVFAYSETCTGVSEEGLYYTLQDYTMTSDTPLGVSNSFIGKEAKIALGEGMLMIVTERNGENNDKEAIGVRNHR